MRPNGPTTSLRLIARRATLARQASWRPKADPAAVGERVVPVSVAFANGTAPSATSADLVPGTIVGMWRVENVIAAGGMGTVYAVIHTAIGKRAALKVIHRDLLSPTYTAEQFLFEARAVNAVEHANIVDIFGSGTLLDGRPYLVMERLVGQTLAERMDAGRVAAIDAITLLLPLCAALAAAHDTGLIHRDLKPDNVFVVHPGAEDQTVKLLDWGIAERVGVDGGADYREMIVGTPRYMAPEQARGEELSSAADIYSLGILAYELFLEDAPFDAESLIQLLNMHKDAPPPPPREVWPDIPPALEELLLAMLAKTADARPALEEVSATLRAVQAELMARQAVVSMCDVEPPVAAAAVLEDEPILLVDVRSTNRRWPQRLAAVLAAGAMAAAAALVSMHGQAATTAVAAIATAPAMSAAMPAVPAAVVAVPQVNTTVVPTQASSIGPAPVIAAPVVVTAPVAVEPTTTKSRRRSTRPAPAETVVVPPALPVVVDGPVTDPDQVPVVVEKVAPVPSATVEEVVAPAPAVKVAPTEPTPAWAPVATPVVAEPSAPSDS